MSNQRLSEVPAPFVKPAEVPSLEEERALLAEILNTVEFKEEGHKERPALRASEFAIGQLAQLDYELQREKPELEQGPKVIAVVRCWNKKEDELKLFIERLRRFKAGIPNLAGVIVSINQEGEKGIGVTEGNLQKIFDEMGMDAGVPIVPLTVERYTWTSGLNGPLAIVNELALRRKMNTEDIRVMNLSFDVELDQENLEVTNELMREQDIIFTVRQTGDQKTPTKDMEDGEKMWTRFKDIMRDPLSTDLSELSYVFRNTYNIFRLSDLVRMGGFNPLCNGAVRKFSSAVPSPGFFQGQRPADVKLAIEGMEDTELAMRMMLYAKETGKLGVFREMRKALRTPVIYRDLAWERSPEVGKIKKIGNEMSALAKILSGLATSEYPSGTVGKKVPARLTRDHRLPPSMQDFHLRQKLAT